MGSTFSTRNNNTALANPVDTLIADFQTAQMLLQAIANAKYQASLAESEAVNKFSSYRHQGEAFVKPQDIPFEEDKSLTHVSLNSHLQKAQSEQIKHHSLQTIHDLEESAKTTFLNKKITITAKDREHSPFHNHWLDRRNGHSYYGNNQSKSVSGRIIEINLNNNYIVLKPSTGRQFVSRSLSSYIAEIIDPNSGQPLVNIIFS
jgi:hypothetical protein